MSILNASAALRMKFMSPPLLPPSPTLSKIHSNTLATTRITTPTTTTRTLVISPSFAVKKETSEPLDKVVEEMEEPRETQLYSFTPLPLFFMAALPGAGAVRSLFGPFVDLIKTWNLPGWLVHWGHPGNMAVVLFAMGGYGTYLALLTSDKPIFESPHAVTGLTGLALLTLQTTLPALFENNPGLRDVHGILGSGIMTLFLVHAALGLQLGLSF
ncbi:hypothetical protein CFP56_038522 [Quercus suber]|uniref:Uncharacterized protein n=1 Tax=Quercus suber TaxID=58331 RepID=A0AAW0LLK5_QUESU